MKVYIAAPWSSKNDKAVETKAQVEKAGHEVISSWIERDTGEPPYSKDFLRSEAMEDVREVLAADVLLLLNLQPRGSETSGKAVETGIMLGKGGFVVLVGEPTNVFHYADHVRIVPTLEEALGVLDTRT